MIYLNLNHIIFNSKFLFLFIYVYIYIYMKTLSTHFDTYSLPNFFLNLASTFLYASAYMYPLPFPFPCNIVFNFLFIVKDILILPKIFNQLLQLFLVPPTNIRYLFAFWFYFIFTSIFGLHFAIREAFFKHSCIFVVTDLKPRKSLRSVFQSNERIFQMLGFTYLNQFQQSLSISIK